MVTIIVINIVITAIMIMKKKLKTTIKENDTNKSINKIHNRMNENALTDYPERTHKNENCNLFNVLTEWKKATSHLAGREPEKK